MQRQKGTEVQENDGPLQLLSRLFDLGPDALSGELHGCSLGVVHGVEVTDMRRVRTGHAVAPSV